MAPSNYAAGRRLEYAARRRLESEGFKVIRSAGSKSPVDLVAFSSMEVRLIQVKGSNARPADRAKLLSFPAPPGASREIWQKQGRVWKIEILEAGR